MKAQDLFCDFSLLSLTFRAADHMFFPRAGCVSDTTLRVHAVLLLVLWVPSAIVSAVVWSLWLLSLQVAVVLASDDVDDLMRDLGPDDVERYLDEDMGVARWKRQVELPAAMLVPR